VNTSEVDCIRGYALGAVDYVSVPVVPEILRAKVSVFLELHRKRRELERAIRSLADAEQRIRGILETATDAIITMDKLGVILTLNPAAERIFGYSAAEMIGVDLHKLMPAALRADDTTPDRDVKMSPVVGTGREVQGVRKDGSVVPLEIAVSEAFPGTVFTAIVRDISQRKQLEREITEIAAAEQRRIGQQLHDGVSQELTGLRMMAAAVRDRRAKGLDADDVLLPQVIEGLARVQDHVRQVSHGLIPVELDGAGLRAALTDLADRIRKQTSVACSFQCPQRVFVKDSLTATNLYHIVQEATNNALRHGQPTRIDIEMNAQSDALVLSIQDDGVGCVPPHGRRDGVGIRLMRHRASLIGGIFQIRPVHAGGTVVTCTLPEWRRNNLFM
jgi:PAS domain S-box-containing protein